MTRNRDQTRQRILDAARLLLVEEGFASFGINGLARRTGCDKQLIYRYFDGLEGVLAALGEQVAAELAAALEPALSPPPESYAALVDRLVGTLYAHLRTDAVYRQLRAVELSDPAGAAAFRAARGRALQSWVAAARGNLAMPADRDTPALNAALVAAAEGLAFGGIGLDPANPATEPRARAALAGIVAAAFG